MNGICFIYYVKFVHPFSRPSPRRPRSLALSWARALFPPQVAAARGAFRRHRGCKSRSLQIKEKSTLFLCFCGVLKVAVVPGFSCFLFFLA
jgi:hypothetical protein